MTATAELRYGFGQNWQRFVEAGVSEAQITSAIDALRALLKTDSLAGRSFLDIGCGSGLHSLAALRLGAERIVSFDYDQNSVAATTRLRDLAGEDAGRWRVEQGSVLNESYLRSLGHFDVVYAWGVLHHTGRMWDAIRLAAFRTTPGGLFALSIYNTQHWRWTRFWRWAKRHYCRAPRWVQRVLMFVYALYMVVPSGIIVTLHGRNPFRRPAQGRGMHFWRDVDDWLGGYPFETATSGELFERVAPWGFTLVTLHSVTNLACNQLTFRRVGSVHPSPQ